MLRGFKTQLHEANKQIVYNKQDSLKFVFTIGLDYPCDQYFPRDSIRSHGNLFRFIYASVSVSLTTYWLTVGWTDGIRSERGRYLIEDCC